MVDVSEITEHMEVVGSDMPFDDQVGALKGTGSVVHKVRVRAANDMDGAENNVEVGSEYRMVGQVDRSARAAWVCRRQVQRVRALDVDCKRTGFVIRHIQRNDRAA